MTRAAILFLALLPGALYCQQVADSNPKQPGQLADNSQATVPESKRLFGIIPNYRTSASLVTYEPLTVKQKFSIASQDAFDRGTFILAAAFAGEAQLSNSNRSFGQGAEGYGKYLAASYAGYVIGDYMTEGIFPSLLHQDPRYFRKGSGSGMARLGYAMGQIFITHGDNERVEVNYSEVLGNSAAVAISQAYYKNNRDASDAVQSLGMQLGVDMASNILKEFSPDITRKFSRKHSSSN